jgi:hypothetical protein
VDRKIDAMSRRHLRRLVGPLLVLVIVLAVVAVVRISDERNSAHWDRATEADLQRMHRDLGESIELLRTAGFEITPKDVAAWLRDLDTGAYLAGGDTSITLLQQDVRAGRFLVMAHGTYHDAVFEKTNTGEACGRLTLTDGVKSPLGLTDVPCPDDVAHATGGVPPCFPCAEERTLLGRTVLRVQQDRLGKTVSSPGLLSPLPGPTRPVGDLRADSTALRCAPGTRDLGVHAAYVEGRRVPVRLCAIPDLPSSGAESVPDRGHYVHGAQGHAIVNARVSGAVLAMARAARQQGVRLRATSSFRTMRHQRDLCGADAGCRAGDYSMVAPPGYSQHQLGVTVDFARTRVTGAQSCTEGRATDPTSRVWRFLHRRAGQFGFRQYAAESWHWDALAGPARCER